MLAAEPSGFVLLCTPEGVIQRIVTDKIGIHRHASPGQSLIHLTRQENISHLLDFLAELNTHNVALNWEIPLLINGNHPIPVHMTGTVLDRQLLIFGTLHNNETMALYQDMMRMQNEQINHLRNAIKKQTELIRRKDTKNIDSNTLYEELSRLNNQLINLQRELTRKNAELQRINQRMTEFLGMATHDLRNPLSVILTYSEFLLETADSLDPQKREFLQIIHDSSRFMLHLVDDLLDFATIESGQLHLEKEPTDLVWLIQNNIARNQLLARKKNITITLEADADLPLLLVDQGQIEQVMNNLVGNAIKFSYPETTILVKIKRENDTIVVFVHDQGPGIPPHEQDRLFKPFSRTSVQSTGGEKSTGLGLAITRKIIEAHNGRIWVTSKEGQGSTFAFSLPIKETNPP